MYETAEKLIAMKNPPLAEVDSAANALVAAIRSSVDVADVLKETFADVVVQDVRAEGTSALAENEIGGG